MEEFRIIAISYENNLHETLYLIEGNEYYYYVPDSSKGKFNKVYPCPVASIAARFIRDWTIFQEPIYNVPSKIAERIIKQQNDPNFIMFCEAQKERFGSKRFNLYIKNQLELNENCLITAISSEKHDGRYTYVIEYKDLYYFIRGNPRGCQFDSIYPSPVFDVACRFVLGWNYLDANTKAVPEIFIERIKRQLEVPRFVEFCEEQKRIFGDKRFYLYDKNKDKELTLYY